MTTVTMYVHAITIDPASKSPILILKEKDGERTLPVWIGLLEATAIATQMEKLEFARPMTHDLAVNMLKAMNINMPRIEITDIRDNTYYARITLVSDSSTASVDARPSDAVALALRTGAEIKVNEEILDHPSSTASATTEAGTEEDGHQADPSEKWRKVLEELDPDSIKYKI